jgi:hypothetical protein
MHVLITFPLVVFFFFHRDGFLFASHSSAEENTNNSNDAARGLLLDVDVKNADFFYCAVESD